MKILYISPVGEKIDIINPDEEKVYDFDSISENICQGIKTNIDNADITMIIDIHNNNSDKIDETIKSFNLCICDFTTKNSNVTYYAGRVESLGLPIIYFASNSTVVPVSFQSKNIITYSEASLEKEFKDEICELIQLASDDPNSFKSTPKKDTLKPKAFISYSHQNKSYLDRLMVHLKPLIKQGVVDVWVDTKIKTGDKWQEQIENALTEASIAILLISADFMASDFIVDNELPPLLSKAEVKGTKILPVILSPCRFSRDLALNRFQAVNSPNKPLSSMSEDEKEKIYDELAEDIEKSIEKSYKKVD